MDYLTVWIDYHVPIERFDELARFDRSCLIDRTAGEVGARCDTEAADTITLNLMHDIVTGKYTVEEARERYTQEMSAYGLGRPPPFIRRRSKSSLRCRGARSGRAAGPKPEPGRLRPKGVAPLKPPLPTAGTAMLKQRSRPVRGSADNYDD